MILTYFPQSNKLLATSNVRGFALYYNQKQSQIGNDNPRYASVRGHSQRARLYALLVPLFIASIALSSCLFFVEPIPSEKVNYPPRIEPDGIDPPVREVVIPATQNPTNGTVFKVVRVSDPNREDILYSYWFLDYTGYPKGSLRCAQEAPALTTDNNPKNYIREVEFSCHIGHSDFPKTGRSVVLELFVVDRKADLNSFLTGIRKWPEGSLYDSYAWTLHIE
jgi:hypothetical protein